MNSFMSGIKFGAGFAISFVVIFALYENFFSVNEPHQLTISIPNNQLREKWNALPYDEQIAQASALVVAEYRQSSDGKFEAFVTEIHSKSANIDIPYGVGDLVPDATYYLTENSVERSGFVKIFISNPPQEASTMFLYDDRIAGYGDMPLKLLVEKFRDSGA